MCNGNLFGMFRLASEVEVKEIISNYPQKSYDLEPLPTWLLKKCVNQLLLLMTAIINRSKDEPVMPLCFKRATIIPLLKRSGLDKEDMKIILLVLTFLLSPNVLKR